MAAIVWFAAGILLAAAEMLGGDLVLLMLGGGALAAALAAWVGAPLWLTGVIFAIVSVGLLLGVRPVIKRHLLRSPSTPMGIEALRGREAEVVASFGNTGGQVRIDGDVWSALPADPHDTFRTGETVIVHQIDGATAVVTRGE